MKFGLFICLVLFIISCADDTRIERTDIPGVKTGHNSLKVLPLDDAATICSKNR